MFIKVSEKVLTQKRCHLNMEEIRRIPKIGARFFWYRMYDVAADFIRSCELCQKQGDVKISTKTELHSVPIPGDVMKQVGVDFCNLPEVDEFHYLFVCIDYFSKWSEARPLKNKSATVIAQALYVLCRHGCFPVQVNDQGREFVNGISTELHKLTRVEQRITSAYHPQSNGLVERQNRTIKYSLVTV